MRVKVSNVPPPNIASVHLACYIFFSFDKDNSIYTKAPIDL